MEDSKQKPGVSGPPDTSPTAERRRLGRIVHDERGNASVEWHDAPPDYQRPVLEIEEGSTTLKRRLKPEWGTEVLSLEPEANGSHDPYARIPTAERKSTSNATRTDLRKLSEWIKMMRELGERKRRGGDED